MSASAVSHAVKTVEDKLGLPLFARTTRSVSLTDAGASFVAKVGPAAAEIADATDSVRAEQGKVTGLLRLNVPSFALDMAVDPVLREMARRYTDLTVEIYVDDGVTDIVADRFDAGVRLGGMIAEDMVAIRLTPPLDLIIVGAPGYLEAHGTPRSIADLANHNCFTYRKVTSGAIWEWALKEGDQDVSVAVKGTVISTDPRYLGSLTLAGLGLCCFFRPLVAEHINAGRLIQVLPETAKVNPGLFLYFPSRASRTPKLRAFIDTARDVLSL